MYNSKKDKVPVIGSDIPWETIQEEDLLAKHFTTFAEVYAGKVKHHSKLLPYGALTVECPKLSAEVTLPITHKLDFHNLWDVFKVRGVNSDEEVLVFYAPSSGIFSAIKPKLHIYIFPKGHQEEMHDPDFKPDDPQAWFTPINKWSPT